VTSNYTLNDLENFKQPIINCQSGKDCPFGSTCDTNYICTYGYFLCINNNKKNCLYINSKVYNPINEEYHVEYRDLFQYSKPVLKTCRKDGIEDKSCKTERCEKNEDCISGSCSSNICLINYGIYLCKGTRRDNNMIFYCGKQAQMKCKKDEECFNQRCISSCCENSNSSVRPKLSKSTTWKIVTLVILFSCIVIASVHTIVKNYV